MPRVFFMASEPRKCSTLTMSTYIYATREEIEAVGDDFVLVETESAAVRHGVINQESRLYRRSDGLLLATSYQTAIHR